MRPNFFIKQLALESNQFLNDYDQKNFVNYTSYFKEEADSLSAIITGNIADTQITIVNNALSYLHDIAIEIPVLEDFFANIHDSILLERMPLTTKVMDTSAVDKVNPKYLYTVSKDIELGIDLYLTGKKSKDEFKRLALDDNYIMNLKRKMVKTTIPLNLKPKDIALYEGDKTLVAFNEELIVTTIIPFLRGLPQTIKDLDVLVEDYSSTIKTSYNNINLYSDVALKMYKNGDIDREKFRFIQAYFYKIVRKFTELASYVGFIILRKISSVRYNLQAFSELRNKILKYHPEGERILHESVLNGSTDDIDLPSVTMAVIRGDNSTLRSMLQATVASQNADYSFNIGHNIDGSSTPDNYLDTVADNHIYDTSIYDRTKSIFTAIAEDLVNLIKNMKDPQCTLTESIHKANLDIPLSDRFTSVISEITDMSNYTPNSLIDNDRDVKLDVFYTTLNELFGASKHTDDIVEEISKTYNLFNEFRESFGVSETSPVTGAMSNEGVRDFIESFDSDYQQLVLNVLQAFIDRFNDLNTIAADIRDEIIVNPDVNHTFDESTVGDYDDFAFESELEIQDAINEHICSDLMTEYYINRTFKETGKHVVFTEAEVTVNTTATPQATAQPAAQPAQTTTTQTTQANTQQTTQPQQNQTTQTQTTVNTNNDAEAANKITNSINTTFDNFVNSNNRLLQAHSNNPATINSVKDEILGRSYGSVELNTPPYADKAPAPEEHVNAIQKIGNGVKAVTADEWKTKSADDISKKILSSTGITISEVGKASEIAETYYKVGNSVQPGGNIPNVIKKGEAARADMQKTIETTLAAYQTMPQINSALGEVKTALITALNNAKTIDASKTVNESVMLEANVQVTGVKDKATGSVVDKVGKVASTIGHFLAGMQNAFNDKINVGVQKIKKMTKDKTKEEMQTNAQTQPVQPVPNPNAQPVQQTTATT